MISATTVERTWQKVAQTNTDEVPRIIGELTDKQPFLLGHLRNVSETTFKREISELFFYLSVVVYLMMKQGRRRVRLVSQEIMRAAEQKITHQMELMESDTDTDFMSATENMLATYPEPEVLRYIVEALVEEDGDIKVSEDDKGILFFELKKVLDALILSRDWYLKQK